MPLNKHCINLNLYYNYKITNLFIQGINFDDGEKSKTD